MTIGYDLADAAITRCLGTTHGKHDWLLYDTHAKCAVCGFREDIQNIPDLGGKITNIGKPSNPKDNIGSDKIPLHLWPSTATALGSMALLDGACKYGRSNFRAVGVRASIYFDAAQRHLCKWFEGENMDPDSGLSHLAHVLACIAILVDAQAADKLNDDRMVKGGYIELLEALTPGVKRVKDHHKDKTPKHYTIEDEV